MLKTLNSSKFPSSTIVNEEQSVQLINLINFSSNKIWRLVYQASRYGFRAEDFHSKTDPNLNTLLLVKTSRSFIFGGYTTANWTGYSYKNDSNAFLFSLVNYLNKPAKMNVKILETARAIVAVPTNGPMFGGGYDMFLASNSNQLKSGSYSNLGCSYQLPFNITYGSPNAQMFLAGAFNFQIAEIEVYV